MRDWIKNRKAAGKLPMVNKHEIGISYSEDNAINRYAAEGAKIPTAVKVEYKGRKRRVYGAFYPDVDELYVIVDGHEQFMDEETAKRVLSKARH